jgi:hypothetical protein
MGSSMSFRHHSSYVGDDRSKIDVMICVDQPSKLGERLDGSNIGGWMPQGMMLQNSLFSIATIGNVLTSNLFFYSILLFNLVLIIFIFYALFIFSNT